MLDRGFAAGGPERPRRRNPGRPDSGAGPKLISAERADDLWNITIRDLASGTNIAWCRPKMLINAGGPWVGDIIQSKIRIDSTQGVRLVRGSHIVTRKLFDHDKCYFFQGEDGRIIFAIPYEQDFTLIGTTDHDHTGPVRATGLYRSRAGLPDAPSRQSTLNAPDNARRCGLDLFRCPPAL